jgi:hypothetical protein
LCNKASTRTISLSWGAKKKESKNSDASQTKECLSVGDCVIVANHGTKRIHLAQIVSIDNSTKLDVVKWDMTQKKDIVDLGDCKKYEDQDVSPRQRTSTDFFLKKPKSGMNKKLDESLNPPPGQFKNMV